MTRQQVSQQLQRYWYIASLVAAAAGSMGTTYLLPGERLAKIEATDLRQDSVAAQMRADFDQHVRDKQASLERIEARFDRLLAGTCIKERDRMTRQAYGCS